MSFIEACAHTCFNLDKAKREKQKWDAAQFEPASKVHIRGAAQGTPLT